MERRVMLSAVTLSIPTGLNAFQGGIVAVPVYVNQLNDGAGHTGINSADFAIDFDPSVFTVSASDVHLGTVPNVGVSWTDTLNQASGQLGINLTSTWKPIGATFGDSLVTIDFHVKSGAPTGLTSINLAANNSAGGGTTTDLFDQNANAYTLTPAPTNASNDVGIDGSVNVLAGASPALGNWTKAANLTISPSAFNPGGIGTMLLLPDGTVMATGGQDGNSQDWFQLTPDTTGSYESGNWTNMASMSTGRLFYGSVVTQNDKVMVLGGEYTTILGPISTAVGTSTTPITITTVNPLPSNLRSGAAVTIGGVSGFGAANGNFNSITITGSNSFTIDGTSGTVGSGTGGTWLSGVGDSNTGEMFTPPATPGGSGSWQPITNFPQVSFGDGQLELMNDGTVLAGYLSNGQSYRYNPATNTWQADAIMLNGDRPNEEAWTKLPDGSILSYEIFGSQPQTAQRFVPGATIGADQWVAAGSVPVKLETTGVGASDTIASINAPGGGTDVSITSTIHLPAALTTGTKVQIGGVSGALGASLNGNTYKITVTGTNTFTLNSTGSISGSGSGGSWSVGLVSGFELGPGFLLPDGRVFQIGATSNTAIYTPPTISNPQGTWTAGPSIPFGLGANDAPGAVLPNGRVLFAASGTPGFGANTTLFEYDPVSNTINQVGNLPSGLNTNLTGEAAFVTRMLVLPSGQVMITDSSGQTYLYQSAGSPQNSWRPTITSVMQNADGSYTLTGTQINGLSEGAAYGDDAQMATNYPIVQIATKGGQTLYAKTFNWSTAGLQTGSTPETVQFTLPAGVSLSQVSTFTVIANGIPSTPVPAQIAPNVIPPADQTGVEGASKAFNLGSFIDPDSTSWTVDVNWGDGAPDTTFSTTTTGSLGTQNHTFAEEGAYTVTVSVTDDSGLKGSATFKVTVSDPAVTPTGGMAISAVEGADSGMQTVATFTDPGGPEVLADYAATINWGDGSPAVSGTITVSGGTFTIQGSHTYGEEGNYAVVVSITHEAAPKAIAVSLATVSDPAVIATGTALKAIACLPLTGVTVATFTDPGGAEPDPSDPSGTINNHYQVVSIDWGDGTPVDTSSGVLSFGGTPGSKTDSFTVSGSHAYQNEGVFTVTIQLSHEGVPTTVTSTVTVKDNIGLLLLDPTGKGALTVSGNGGVSVNNDCGALVVDSNNPAAAIINGNGAVSAGDLDVTGGSVVHGNGAFLDPIDHEAPTPDPIALPLPAAPTSTFAAVNYSGSTTLTLSPGTYLGGIHISGQGNVVLSPGIYYLAGGGLQVSGGGSLTGNGVMIINAPATPNDGISFTGQGNVNLTAPLAASLPAVYSGYAGITIFEDPASAAPIRLAGNGNVTMDGAIYAASATLFITGNGGLTDSTDTIAPVAEVIVYDAVLAGNGGLTVNADAPASNPPAVPPLPGAAQAVFSSFAVSANPAVPGQPITFTVTMSAIPASASPPGGLVDFFDQTTHLDLGSITLSGGVGSITTSAISILGGHLITANYFASSPNYISPAPASLTEQLQSAVNEGGVLFVGGSSSSSGISVQSNGSQLVVDAHDGAGKTTIPLAGLTALAVYGHGSESIQVDNGVTLPAFLFAGTGNGVHIQGGGGPTVEVGGGGAGDILTGGSGRNILIADGGGATLQGGPGGSILIGGSTDFDHNLPVLQAVLAIWNTSASYSIRLAALGATFNTTTVHNDGTVDRLRGVGGNAALDWFFASSVDQLTGNNVAETVTSLL